MEKTTVYRVQYSLPSACALLCSGHLAPGDSCILLKSVASEPRAILFSLHNLFLKGLCLVRTILAKLFCVCGTLVKPIDFRSRSQIFKRISRIILKHLPISINSRVHDTVMYIYLF